MAQRWLTMVLCMGIVWSRAQQPIPDIHSRPGIHPEVAVGSIAAVVEEHSVVPGVVVEGSFAGKAEP